MRGKALRTRVAACAFATCIAATLLLTLAIPAFAATESEPNNERPGADLIEVNENVNGSCDGDPHSYSYDWYKFVLTSDGYVTVNFEKANPDDTETWFVVELYNSQKECQWQRSSRYPSLSSKRVGLPSGTYYLLVEGQGDDVNAGYSFCVDFHESSTWESEPNDSTMTSDLIELGERWYGTAINSTYEYETDYYKLVLDSKTTVKLSFSKLDTDDTETPFDIWLKDGYENYFIDTSTRHPTYKSSKITLASGTYYLGFKVWKSRAESEYSFEISNDYSPDSTSITSLVAGKKKATVSWSKSSDATGYQVNYKLAGGSWKLAKTVTSPNTLKYIKKSLKKGKVYSFKVRAYKTSGGKNYYSAWSTTKSVRVK